MHVISVKDLLKLDRLDPHQVLLQKGLLHLWCQSMRGRTIFVSHEWLGWQHADPNGEQLVALQRILTRLLKGEISRVQSHWRTQLEFGNTVVAGRRWKAAVPHMFAWLDFLSIPQTAAYCDLSTSEDLKNAVESIPAYVERSALLLILVPVCVHLDRQESCSFSTWRKRGWCVLELHAAFLKCGGMHIMVCEGSEALPYFIIPSEAFHLTCGTGYQLKLMSY